MNKNVTEIDLKKVIVKFFNDVIGLPIEYEHADAIYILARAATKEIREEHDLNLKKLGFKDRTIWKNKGSLKNHLSQRNKNRL